MQEQIIKSCVQFSSKKYYFSVFYCSEQYSLDAGKSTGIFLRRYSYYYKFGHFNNYGWLKTKSDC